MHVDFGPYSRALRVKTPPQRITEDWDWFTLRFLQRRKSQGSLYVEFRVEERLRIQALIFALVSLQANFHKA